MLFPVYGGPEIGTLRIEPRARPSFVDQGLIEARTFDARAFEIAADKPRAREIKTTQIAAAEIYARPISETQMLLRVQSRDSDQFRKVISGRIVDRRFRVSNSNCDSALISVISRCKFDLGNCQLAMPSSPPQDSAAPGAS